jgi:hypothetical protein
VPTVRDPANHEHLACMEVWGGNTRTRTAVTMPGNDVQVIPRRCGGRPGQSDGRC